MMRYEVLGEDINAIKALVLLIIVMSKKVKKP
jgi:hypothetical protein